MSHSFLISLVAVVVVVLAARWVLAVLPVGAAARLTVADAVLFAVGVLGLVFHCGAMFYPRTFAHLPGASAAIGSIDRLGTASIVWYCLAAVLVLAGLRRQHPLAIGVLALALVAVGVTMYDGGPLPVHLTTIFVSVVLLAATTALLVLPPWRSEPGRRAAKT